MIPLVLKDGRETPGTVEFKPRSTEGGVTTFVSNPGVPLAERRITYSQNRTATGCVKITSKLVWPIVQNVTVDGVSRPTVVRTAYADITLNFDGGSSVAEREDVSSFASQMVHLWQQYPLVYDYVVGLNGFY